ncbi:MAG TPA: pseudouridine synthase [Patescibacteria group bacterium]
MAKIRLNKFIAQLGLASRRHADNLIQDGQVVINGVKAVLGDKVDPENDRIFISGKLVSRDRQQFVYYILNKPLGVLSSSSDDRGRQTVVDLVPSRERLFPVGRLDYNSSGLILLTNDGDLALRLTHPRYHLPKVYLVNVKGFPTSDQLHQLSSGVDLDDGKTTKSDVVIFHRSKTQTTLKITLYQGKKRQIRRMCEAVGLLLYSLHRISIGPIELDNLPIGHWRKLTSVEVSSLKKSD